MVCHGLIFRLAQRRDAGGKSLIAPRSGRLVRGANHDYQPIDPKNAWRLQSLMDILKLGMILSVDLQTPPCE